MKIIFRWEKIHQSLKENRFIYKLVEITATNRLPRINFFIINRQNMECHYAINHTSLSATLSSLVNKLHTNTSKIYISSFLILTYKQPFSFKGLHKLNKFYIYTIVNQWNSIFHFVKEFDWIHSSLKWCTKWE